MNASLETYDKLRGGGFSDEQARVLSEAIGEAGQQKRLSAIEQRVGGLEERMSDLEASVKVLAGKIDNFRRELTVHRWVLGFVVASNLAILAKLLAG
jgi:predicted RNase H-like nuclease (RuvC/YqgF family)